MNLQAPLELMVEVLEIKRPSGPPEQPRSDSNTNKNTDRNINTNKISNRNITLFCKVKPNPPSASGWGPCPGVPQADEQSHVFDQI